MSNFSQFFKRTFIAGVLVLLPALLIWVLFSKIWNPLANFIGRLSQRLHVELFWGVSLLGLLTLLAIIILCFLLGLVTHFAIVASFHRWIESNLLRFMPGYKYIKIILLERLGAGDNGEKHSILIFLNGTWQPGLLIEEMPDQWLVVFIPFAPASDLGTIHIVQQKNTRKIDRSLSDFHESIQRFGKGMLSSQELDLQ